MLKMTFSIAAAALMIAVTSPGFAGPTGGLPATDVSAQGVVLDVPGVGVRIGDRHHRHESRRAHRRDNCRTVTVREVRRNGDVVTRTRTKC